MQNFCLTLSSEPGYRKNYLRRIQVEKVCWPQTGRTTVASFVVRPSLKVEKKPRLIIKTDIVYSLISFSFFKSQEKR